MCRENNKTHTQKIDIVCDQQMIQNLKVDGFKKHTERERERRRVNESEIKGGKIIHKRVERDAFEFNRLKWFSSKNKNESELNEKMSMEFECVKSDFTFIQFFKSNSMIPKIKFS